MKMPFGKYKNQNITDIDTSYLNWLLDNSSNLDYYLKRFIQNHLESLENSFVDVNAEAIKKIYYQLSKKYHPDMGGSNEAMKAINEFYNLLKKK
jgi:hypothetical protein